MFDPYLLEACSFQMRDRKGVDPNGRGGRDQLARREGGETVIMVYCMRKESVFDKKGKWKKILSSG